MVSNGLPQLPANIEPQFPVSLPPAPAPHVQRDPVLLQTDLAADRADSDHHHCWVCSDLFCLWVVRCGSGFGQAPMG